MNRLLSLYRSAGPTGAALTMVEHLTRPNPYKRIAGRMEGLRALEIGGPSKRFAPIYARLSTCDNVTYSKETIWEGKVKDDYRPSPNIVGRQYILDIDLGDIGPYDAVLSSHVLEHIANPIKALKEWKRVLKPGGTFLMVVPDGRRSFDHRREPTTLEHLIEDYEDDVQEDSLFHIPEVLRKHDIRRDPALSGRAELERRLANNAELRTLHHHVFTPELVKDLMGYVGIEAEVFTRRPYDIVACSVE